jgi:HSP20 family molecular chaperone IbpA
MFYRSFTLPVPVKSSEAKAVYKDGIVKIAAPKQKESRTHKLEIE